MWFFPAVLLAGIVAAGAVAALYNRLVRLRNTVASSWSDIGVLLKKRYDLVDNLVETVKGYAAHEKTTLDQRHRGALPRFRRGFPGREIPGRRRVRPGARQPLRRGGELPRPQGQHRLSRLQQQVRDLEDQIEGARRTYNTVVRDFNTLIESFPSNLVAESFGFTKAEFFEPPPPAEAAAAPDLVQGVSGHASARSPSAGGRAGGGRRRRRARTPRRSPGLRPRAPLASSTARTVVAVVAARLDARIDETRARRPVRGEPARTAACGGFPPVDAVADPGAAPTAAPSTSRTIDRSRPAAVSADGGAGHPVPGDRQRLRNRAAAAHGVPKLHAVDVRDFARQHLVASRSGARRTRIPPSRESPPPRRPPPTEPPGAGCARAPRAPRARGRRGAPGPGNRASRGPRGRARAARARARRPGRRADAAAPSCRRPRAPAPGASPGDGERPR